LIQQENNCRKVKEQIAEEVKHESSTENSNPKLKFLELCRQVNRENSQGEIETEFLQFSTQD